MKSNILILILSCGMAAGLYGQSYNTAAGMRLGTDWGITLKQRVADHTTLEGIIQTSLQREEAIVSLLAEQHFPLIFRRFNLYAGGGFHKGWLDNPAPDPDTGEIPTDPFGVSFIGGIEFSLGRLNLTYDFKPAINLSGGEKRLYNQTGISLRYIIVKREWSVFGDKNKKKKNKKGSSNWKFWEKD